MSVLCMQLCHLSANENDLINSIKNCVDTLKLQKCVSEGCNEPEETDCSGQTEYNKYIECMHEKRRHKRSLGCTDSCEFIDCSECQNTCQPDCPECGVCSNSCRQCCSETCTSNLCCHKTCHNQCKTSYCRTECKKECKTRISDTSSSSVINNQQNSTNLGAHNITTIINLQNIINNTNHIDIPIKINNTNYNNVTLQNRRSDLSSAASQFAQQQKLEVDAHGNRCCHVIGPKQCNKTSTFPYLKCFHYRYKKCGDFCVSDVVHMQEQQYCGNGGCHLRYIYIPEPQQRCVYQPTWPFVNCGEQNYEPPSYYQPQSYLPQPGYFPPMPYIPPPPPISPCFQIGCQYPPPPSIYPNYPAYPPYGMPNYGYPNYGYPPVGYPPYAYPGYSGYSDQSLNPGYGTGNNEVLGNYPVGPYVYDTVISGNTINKTLNDYTGYQQDPGLKIDFTSPRLKTTRYAVISIDAPKTEEEQKEKHLKKRANKDKNKNIKKTTVDKSQKVTKKPLTIFVVSFYSSPCLTERIKMNLWLLLLITLLVAFTTGLEINMLDENEPDSCLEHRNIFGYSHCIKKRQATCNNTPCGLCNNNSCKVCNSNNCMQSCSGTACNQCPTGNCCTGQNCNVCSSGSCCQSSSCNSCATACSSGCSTWDCRDSCIKNCQSPSFTCSSSNTCFDNCRSQCSDDACFQTCIEKCKNCSTPDIIIHPSSNETIQHLQNYTVHVVNKSPVNITTVINLKNYILNNHTIQVPVNVNNTNHNYISSGSKESQLNANYTLKVDMPTPEKCCFVVHPVYCQKIDNQVRCFQKRHWECSPICTSVVIRVVHVPRMVPVNNYVSVPQPYPVMQPVPVARPVPVPQPIPVPQPVMVQQNVPVPVAQPPQVVRVPVYYPLQVPQQTSFTGYANRCHHINSYPWIQCGRYGLQNCGSCYSCGAGYNPSTCSASAGCALGCRNNLFLNDPYAQQLIQQYAPYYTSLPQQAPNQNVGNT
ncbi:hypothetical protein CBL_08231 [Carabus blaptoides fortunei]